MLILDAVLGLVAGVVLDRAVLRILAWLLVPLTVSVLAIGPPNFSSATGEREWVWLNLGCFFMFGSPAMGIGMIIGKYVRLLKKSKK